MCFVAGWMLTLPGQAFLAMVLIGVPILLSLCTASPHHRQRLSSATEGVPKMRVAILATVVAVMIGFALPASADERPSDPFGNHTIEINNKEDPSRWNMGVPGKANAS